ncbi:MAG: hypothetical protein HYW34_00960 [Candidatus Brennerbacteria bacterium]|nr:hypothetical protein [Candidatus Brennerbacteria bacterium]
MEDEKQPLSGQVPPPPPPEIGVRTMQSDMQSMQKSGGDPPQPYIINSGNSIPQKPAAEPASSPTPQPKITAQGYTGPEQPIFQEPNEPIFTPANQISQNNGGETPKKGGGVKIIIWVAAVLIIAGALGALGYFVIFPILFPGQSKPIAQEPTPQPIIPQPEPQPTPTPPVPEPVMPTSTPEPIITEPTTTAEIAPPVLEIKPHVSFFTASSAVPQEKAVGESFILENIITFVSSAAATLNANELKEITFEKPDGSYFSKLELLSSITMVRIFQN